MPWKLKFGKNGKNGGRKHQVLLVLAAAVLICIALGGIVFGYMYMKYQKIVDDRLAAGPIFANVAQIYAAPREVRVGQHLSATTIAQDLRSAGYNANPKLGTFTVDGPSINIKPGPESYHSTDGATITTGRDDQDDSGTVVRAITAENGAALAAYELEPQLITALSEDKNRTKRRLVSYSEIPTELVQAVTSIEDRRFFEHHGVNYVRTIECGVHDLISGRKACGGSTLTQQLAKNFFLKPDKTISRKVAELMITMQLEARFSKQQIFEMYANEMNLVHRGSYEINGVAEASQTLFGKDLRQLDLAQDATLAALFQNPSYRNPYRHPERTMERRNLVLDSMVETGAITGAQAAKAKAEGLGIVQTNIDAGEAPYFVDLVHDQLAQRLGDQGLEHDSLRIYTSLDPELQRAASDAVEAGMKNVDELVRKRHKKSDPSTLTYPQVALVALNPHTGQILALIGGRNYGISQLNHAVSERPTGSIFKPFVYATAYNSSLNGTEFDANGVFTAISMLDDDPRTFMFDGKAYTPGNFEHGEYPGMVTAAQALAHSLNIATIGLAEHIGYENVATVARAAGITSVHATPSMAIGTYSATPIDMAGAYTVFANGGVREQPWLLASVRNANGDVVADFAPTGKQVLDPRTAYLTQSLMENAMTFGTASAVRAHGFRAPGAGKTGTSHDAWFAGYTSNLLCIIWVGNDDYTDIKLQGADAAAPIWAEFMNRAIKLPQYSDMKPFSAPDGVHQVRIDKNTWLPADDTCPQDYYIGFLDGTVPNSTCSHMGEMGGMLLPGLSPGGTPNPNAQPGQPGQPQPTEPAPQKRNFFQRLFGAGKKQPEQPAPQQQQQQPQQ
ncbi:MAG TPA: transglycosylase domain-containing protein [Acidobacteriaceae bacterium]|jgi:penicillin-binding protein 1B|nr:transglycosylase domain-containing protein [Acidobacteriaceae bacterium]